MKYRGIAIAGRLLFSSMLLASFAVTVFTQNSITLVADATEAARGITHITETIPVTPGPFSLFYPKWIPGEHQPSGPLNNMINLHITADGKPISWRRDDVEMFAFHCQIPAGVRSITISFDDAADPWTTASSKLARIKWNRMLLYPRPIPADKINVTGTLKMPKGWQYATALPVDFQTPDSVTFKPVSLEKFVDSPAMIGVNFKKIVLSNDGVLHELDIAAENEKDLEFTPETLAGWKNLVKQANVMFGARHYNSYRFLLTLSNFGGREGLEHHESSEDGVGKDALRDPEGLIDLGDLLGHEMTHSWNGKYRRPAGLVTLNFEQPMKGDLLWVYEGLTQYLGNVLPARSGLWTPEVFRETLADVAAQMQNQTGRRWRPLVDTARAVQFTRLGKIGWRNQRRQTDYYYEGQLIWLDADVLIRQKTEGKRSLDDFLRAFYGGQNSGSMVKPYTLTDVVTALNKVVPFDWKKFFDERVYSVENEAPLNGITNGGWKLEYSDVPNIRVAGLEKRDSTNYAIYSLGLIMDSTGGITDILPGSAADKAGLAPGMLILGKDGKEFSLKDLETTIAESKAISGPIKLIVDNSGFTGEYLLDYHGGPRYPHLVRDPAKKDTLADIIKIR